MDEKILNTWIWVAYMQGIYDSYKTKKYNEKNEHLLDNKTYQRDMVKHIRFTFQNKIKELKQEKT